MHIWAKVVVMMLKIENLNTSYGHIHALKGIDMEVNQGEIVTLVGSNGAGKTTTLMSIMRLLTAAPGSVIEFEGESLNKLSTSDIVKRGISLVPEGREVFPKLSVQDNLRLGAYSRQERSGMLDSFERVYGLFPRLKEREKQMVGTLSGGEQQMLAIGRSLMSKPRLLMLDEPSLGLAPNLVQTIFELIKEIHNQGITVLLVEQNAFQALRIADRGYILETGRVKLTDSAINLRNNDEVRKAYLGSI